MKAGVSTEVVDAELHRVKFERLRKVHPTPGSSFLDACVMGPGNLINQYAAPGEELSRLLVDAAEKGQDKVVEALSLACVNPNLHTWVGDTPCVWP